MIKYIFFSFCFLIFSCDFFFKKEHHEFIYEFEKEGKIENADFTATVSVLKKRLAMLGYDYEIKRHGQDNIKIRVEAKELNTQRFDKLISNQGNLEFWETYKGDAFLSFLFKFNKALLEEGQKTKDSIQKRSLVDLIAGQGYKGGPVVMQAKVEDTTIISAYLNKKEARLYYPSGCSHVKFLWGIREGDLLPLYAVKSNREHKAPLNGECIIDANQGFGYTGSSEVNIVMDKKGALTWERMTGKAFRNSTFIAITVNDVVYSAPGVVSGAITGGKTAVSGNFTIEEAQDLAVILSSQYRIPKLKLLEHKVIK